ncbi:MAG TPA: hypothetical protein VI564_05250 [Candidatus Nanoarchaeia archaeon]|nr:hypothetical protein [Candidatus Nanoarchaeia archaeon]
MKPNQQHSHIHSEKTYLYERPIFQYVLVFSIIATLAISIISLITVYDLKQSVTPRTINVNDFLKKLTAHDEAKSYVGTAPLNIVQISQNNFGSLQTQISGLDVSFMGNFIVQYQDRVFIYDYDKDLVKGTVTLSQNNGDANSQLPSDFFAKLSAHPEVKGLEKEQPVGGVLDEATLNTLRQQFPDVYSGAKVGDFLLRFQTKLIIYDYNSDRIVKSVNLT